MAWLIKIDELTPSQNRLARAYRHHSVYARLRDRLEGWCMVARMNQQIPPAAGKRRVVVRRYVRSRRYLLDRGNFVGGCKPLLDALQRQGIIADDCEALLEDVYEQHVERGAGAGHTLVVVEDA